VKTVKRAKTANNTADSNTVKAEQVDQVGQKIRSEMERVREFAQFHREKAKFSLKADRERGIGQPTAKYFLFFATSLVA
jgi:hypothetical protein